MRHRWRTSGVELISARGWAWCRDNARRVDSHGPAKCHRWPARYQAVVGHRSMIGLRHARRSGSTAAPLADQHAVSQAKDTHRGRSGQLRWCAPSGTLRKAKIRVKSITCGRFCKRISIFIYNGSSPFLIIADMICYCNHPAGHTTAPIVVFRWFPIFSTWTSCATRWTATIGN